MQHKVQNTANEKLQNGDAVLIKETLPRGQWKIGKITKSIKVRDNLIRSAEVTFPSRKCLHRAIKLLYPVECADDDCNVEDNPKTESIAAELKFKNN